MKKLSFAKKRTSLICLGILVFFVMKCSRAEKRKAQEESNSGNIDCKPPRLSILKWFLILSLFLYCFLQIFDNKLEFPI